MERIVGFVLMFVVVLFVQCSDGAKKKNDKKEIEQNLAGEITAYPKFEFSKELHKFGEISEGEIAICEFYFKNIGQRDLIISNIESNCGCTNIKWDKKPIKFGKESKISIEFDSKGRYGKQYKVITVLCNTLEKEKKLYVTAQVK